MTTPLYDVLKHSTYAIACEATGSDNRAAVWEGCRDVYDLLLADTDADSMPVFVSLLMDAVPSEEQRRLLLDGLAQEYAGLQAWTAYVARLPTVYH